MINTRWIGIQNLIKSCATSAPPTTKCAAVPVAYSEFLGWSLFRHEDVTRALHDHKTVSSAGSQHLSVPGGMDQPEHTAYRRIIEADGDVRTHLSRDCREAGAGLERARRSG